MTQGDSLIPSHHHHMEYSLSLLVLNMDSPLHVEELIEKEIDENQD